MAYNHEQIGLLITSLAHNANYVYVNKIRLKMLGIYRLLKTCILSINCQFDVNYISNASVYMFRCLKMSGFVQLMCS